jgi:hypothetical protein
VTRTNTGPARNAAHLHEQRIAAETNPRRRLAQAWAWLYSEIVRLPPEQVDQATDQIRRHANRLNTRRTNTKRRGRRRTR